MRSSAEGKITASQASAAAGIPVRVLVPEITFEGPPNIPRHTRCSPGRAPNRVSNCTVVWISDERQGLHYLALPLRHCCSDKRSPAKVTVRKPKSH
jgi:hypothetical protein